MDRNPLIEPEDFFIGYNKSIEELKNNPDVIELDKLCYELFEANETGKVFIKLVTERYLIPSLAGRNKDMYQVDVIWGEGFKDAFRMIINYIKSHKQRIQAGLK